MTQDNPFQIISSQWLSLAEASKKYEIPDTVLAEWIKQHHITATLIGTRWVIKESSLMFYKEHQKKLNKLEFEFNTCMNKKKQELDEIISREKDPIHLPKKPCKEAFYFNFAIKELSYLIESPKGASVFQKFGVGKNTYKINKEHSISYDKLYFHYRRGVQHLLTNPLFHEPDYHISMKQKNKEIELLEIECKDYENKIVEKCLKEYGEYLKKTDFNLQSDEIDILVQYLNGLNLKKETLDLLHGAGFSTTESLIRYLLQNNFEILYEKKIIRKVHLKDLQNKFAKANILKYFLLPE